MQIYVCIKHVPDTAARIALDTPTAIVEQDLKYIVNPYDEFAVEEAVSLVEKQGSGEVIVVTVGKAEASATMRGALAMGADRGILVTTQGQFPDSTLIAQALKAAIEQDGSPDIIFTGKGAVDTETFQTHYRLAALMDLPVVSDISTLEIQEGTARAEREIGGGDRQVLEMKLPGIIGATKGLNEPRYPKFPQIMKAKKKEIKEIPLAELGIDEQAGVSVLESLTPSPERSGATMIEGDAQTQAGELVRIFREQKIVS